MKSNLKVIVDVKAVEKNISELKKDLGSKELTKKDKKDLKHQLESLINQLENLGKSKTPKF